MKKLSLIVSLALLITCKAMAVSVSLSSAQTVALNFYKSTAPGAANNKWLRATLNYTGSSNGTVSFYVFNIIPATGFVIVSADDVTEPILGYSYESNFNANAKHIGITNWMNTTSQRINAIITQRLPASGEISDLWNAYNQGVQPNATQGAPVGPLLTTTWNQEPYYNMYCPYNATDSERCVTGCVACAMAQIMKYWNYPATGTSSYSYDNAPPYYSNNYGTQSANFGATTYKWTSMPNSINSNNTYIGTLMYQCGVSVAMDYGDDNEGGSGAYVFQSQSGGPDNPCAQQAYALYFSYNANTMQGLTQSSYTNAAWITLLQTELNAGRPVQYEGWDPSAGGHTWVCDGYDAANKFHMNWGWGGYDNGFYSLSNLNPNPYTFSSNDGALIGIEPPAACGVPTGLSTSNITTSGAKFNWTAVSGALSYNIQFEAVGASTWTTGTSATNSFTASGLTASTNYNWQVETVCSGGSSAFTSSTSFTTLTPPCNMPTGLSTSSITTSSATFNWTAVSGAVSYNIQYEAVGASTWTTGTSATNSFTASGLAASTNYNWQVETVCSGGSSAFTSSTSFTTLTPPCNMPTCLSTSSITTSSATFNWTAVSGAVSYNIQYEEAGASTWTTGTSASNSFTASGLAASTNYVWQVETVCSGGSSAFTSSTSFTTLTPPCNMPTGLSTASITTSSATFNWTAVSGAVSYNIQYEAVGASSWTTGTSSTDSFNVSGLASSTNYVWQVQTICSGGSSAFTSSVNFTTATASFGIPSGLSAASISDSGAALTWDTVTGAVSYTLQWKAVSGASWTPVAGLTTNSYALSGLTSCDDYEFEVLTVCGGGASAYSSVNEFNSGCPLNYGISEGTDNTYGYIDNVNLGTINNTGTNDSIGYANFTNLSTNLAGGTTYTISLTPGFIGSPYDEFWVVWIDYNQNGAFTDAGENVAEGDSTGTVNLSFTVPITALNGPTRMRIQMQYGAYPDSSCLIYTYGEVEDYTVNITGNTGGTYTGVISPAAENITNEIKLYPNPAQDNLTMDYSTQQHADAVVNIYDVIGNNVITQEFDAAEGMNTLHINTTALNNGIYIFEVVNNNGVMQRQKFMVVK